MGSGLGWGWGWGWGFITLTLCVPRYEFPLPSLFLPPRNLNLIPGRRSVAPLSYSPCFRLCRAGEGGEGGAVRLHRPPRERNSPRFPFSRPPPPPPPPPPRCGPISHLQNILQTTLCIGRREFSLSFVSAGAPSLQSESNELRCSFIRGLFISMETFLSLSLSLSSVSCSARMPQRRGGRKRGRLGLVGCLAERGEGESSRHAKKKAG